VVKFYKLVLGKAAQQQPPPETSSINATNPIFEILRTCYIHFTVNMLAPRVGNAGERWDPQSPEHVPDASGKQQHAAGKPPNSTEDADAHWRKIIDCLNEVGSCLKKDSSKSPLYDKSPGGERPARGRLDAGFTQCKTLWRTGLPALRE